VELAAGGPSAHRARGHPALALTLPGLSYYGSPAGLGLAHALDYVVSEVERRDLANVVLACHSWGGYPATGAAHKLAARRAKGTGTWANAVKPGA
jgi:hypothetical protein